MLSWLAKQVEAASAAKRRRQRTKTEHPATILLPNSVAAHDTERVVMDGRGKKFKEYNTAHYQ
jgi:hypothetical protein